MSDPIPNRPIRVLSIDDSAFFRKVLTEILGHHADIDLVGCASDAYEARDQLLSTQVDVLTLDIEMPRMAGLTFLKLIMERKPMPVIVLSCQTPPGSPKAVEALIAGAFNVIEKPVNLSNKRDFGEKLIRDIKTAAAAPKRHRFPTMLTNCLKTQRFGMPKAPPVPQYDPRQIIALGASTGGTQALEEVLSMLPANLPGIVAVQHIPADFSTSFAVRLNQVCAMEVREAADGDRVCPGLALIAPGDRHMDIHWARDHYYVHLHDGPRVEHQRPSVDVLFESLAHSAGPHTVATLLTGMGRDGAAGMKRLHDLDAYTIAQDADSSVVYGMARQAVELHAVKSIVSLEKIAGEIVKALETQNQRATVKTHE